MDYLFPVVEKEGDITYQINPTRKALVPFLLWVGLIKDPPLTADPKGKKTPEQAGDEPKRYFSKNGSSSANPVSDLPFQKIAPSKPRAKEATQVDAQKCVICSDRDVRFVFRPCNHPAICLDCRNSDVAMTGIRTGEATYFCTKCSGEKQTLEELLPEIKN